jgi:hypothetical protein
MKASAAQIIHEAEREERPLPKPRGWDPLSGVLPGPEDLPPYWTGGWVGKRMIEAFRILRQMPEGERPDWSKRSMWPAFQHEFADAVHQGDDWRKRIVSALERPRLGADSVEVSRMEEAIEWPMDYLRYHPGEARCLMLWSLATASPRLIIAKELRRRGWKRSTFEKRRRDGAERIARGLIAMNVPVR